MTAPWRPTEQELAAMVYRESRLLDEKRYDEWYALFAEDGRYWVPLAQDQSDPLAQQSIAYEDKMLLRVRVERLKAGKAYSQRPPVVCQHVLQAPWIEQADHAAGRYVTRAPFTYVESRRDDQVLLTGTVSHSLCVEGDTLKISLKRVDLLNAGAALPGIFLFP